MAKIEEPFLFSWREVEAESDLDRLRLVFEHLPDEELMQKLEGHRGQGRNDYPIRPVWNSILAGIVYQHKSIESLRRELMRNGELRELCGFNPLLGASAVPPSWVYTRFLKLLFKFAGEIEVIFHWLVDELKELLFSLVEEIESEKRYIYFKEGYRWDLKLKTLQQDGSDIHLTKKEQLLEVIKKVTAISINDTEPLLTPPLDKGAFLYLSFPKFKPIPPPALLISVASENVLSKIRKR